MSSLALADPDQILQTLSNDLMSPYCPGRTISSCPSDRARDLEQRILTEAKAGKSRDDIEQGLVRDFGPEIRGYEGSPVLLYGSLVTGLVVLVVLVMAGRRWARRPVLAGAAVAAAGASPTRAELDRLEDALDEVDDF
ncbi:cytochrome c-type biogenesis protein CcmH [Paraliomyxa miuraensis]|uniref:cytochrome c-type biogenesis protein CcmH n=1 Tax=Paraliomyxa miuraensis TaxID=376150 RepID=UPI002257F15F|nr:cytochrome c-type biogenesis protein CcmH [Paraliomyxa miuraensis]MCX4244568.1 cytochrome c-type biogenesis protein CcmH [Paraliomyxa miuraensis]